MAREGEETPQLPWQKVDNPDVPDNPDNDYYQGEAASHKINVKPQSLTTKAKTIAAKQESLTATIKTISDTWNALDLGWVGQTQKEADDFNNRFQAAYKAMFGNDKTPDKLADISSGECALGKIKALADAASQTYANAEEGLTGSLYRFGEQLAGTYNSTEWGDPAKPEDHKHPEFKEDIPTLETEKPDPETVDPKRNFTNAPIKEVTPT
ncbi:WXG100 family type VII secretion target [Actinoplanes sp. NPDC049265]|uniref:WXG100 family type VII secretion target n=1 Tax=Actinoplanes sp. NPDC049265 TaxID=3363902 RepID=UPI003714BCC9